MLAKYWRLHFYWVGDDPLVYNNDARVVVRSSPWKLSSGVLTFGTTIDDSANILTTGGTIASLASSAGGVNDNTSSLNWGIKGFLKVIADAATDGVGYLYLEESDDNTNWPSTVDADEFDITKDLRLVGAVNIATNATDEGNGVNFEF